jgi:hypothetical protein
MTYPSGAAYGDALQFPRTSVLDPMLASGTVQVDALGIPFGRSGQFALTYKISANGQDYAFRCFQSERPGIHDRYIAISNERLATRLPYFVDFTYLDPGVRVQGATYPALRMEWAEGLTLGTFIEQHLGDPGRLRALQQQLHGMALALEGAGIAHGDIQSGNIVVGPSGELKLVDYDGMYVTSLAGLGPLETGHANFQHPQRSQINPFDPTLDRFSFALLHATLAGLAENPALWSLLGGEPEAPLLRKADFDNPSQSTAFRTLTRLPQSGEVFERLMRLCQSPYSAIPSFSDFLSGRNIPTPVTSVAAPAAKAATSPGHTSQRGSAAPSTPAASDNASLLSGLVAAASPAASTPLTAPFSGKQPTPTVTSSPAAAARPAQLGIPTPSRRDAYLPLIGVAAFVFLIVAVAGIITLLVVVGGTSGESQSQSVATTNDAPTAPTPAPTPTSTPAADMVDSCWQVDPTDSSQLLPVACSTSGTDFRVSKVATVVSQCGADYMTWDDGKYLCLEEWPPPTYEICYTADSYDEPVCQAGLSKEQLSWGYSSCWEGARGAVLQQRVDGTWRTVKSDFSKRDANGLCDAEFPWLVEFVRKAAGPGTKEYRIYFPAVDGFSETIENITVTVRKEK